MNWRSGDRAPFPRQEQLAIFYSWRHFVL